MPVIFLRFQAKTVSFLVPRLVNVGPANKAKLRLRKLPVMFASCPVTYPSLSSTSAHVASSNPARKERKVSCWLTSSLLTLILSFSIKDEMKELWLQKNNCLHLRHFPGCSIIYSFFILRMWIVTDEIERTRWFVGGVKALSVYYNSSLRIALLFLRCWIKDKGMGYNSQTWSLKRWNYSAATTETTHACREPPGTFLARDGGRMVSNYFSGNIK